MNRKINVGLYLKHPKAVKPEKAHEADAGFDLTAVSLAFDGEYLEYDTGVVVSIPKGYVGLLFSRSSVSKKDLVLSNCVGVIDSGYSGTLKMRFKSLKVDGEIYMPGDRIGQLVVMEAPYVEFEQMMQAEETARGDGGFGSSGL